MVHINNHIIYCLNTQHIYFQKTEQQVYTQTRNYLTIRTQFQLSYQLQTSIMLFVHRHVTSDFLQIWVSPHVQIDIPYITFFNLSQCPFLCDCLRILIMCFSYNYRPSYHTSYRLSRHTYFQLYLQISLSYLI